MGYILIVLFVVLGIIYFFKKPIKQELAAPLIDDSFLEQNVRFYASLNNLDRLRFQDDMNYFFKHTKITGVDTHVTDDIKMLVAAGAVIPLFNFPKWHYHNLNEVLVYSDSFNHSFESAGNSERNILGMVGTGYMEGKMLLSKPAIIHSFQNKTDKHNTIIHEFVHLLDKADGDIDGIPRVLIEQQYILPWLDMVHKETLRIKAGKNDIDDYAYTGKEEFFAVAAEYFFERPDLLQKKHPQLFSLLSEMFDGD